MASTGKKGKKSKGTVISLQSFLSNGSDAPVGTTQVSKKVRNYDGDDSDDGGSSLPLVLQLPTAPRANRIFEDDSIPHKPPFLAYITNLPFDANEEDIYDFFGEESIVSLRLPREDGETGRVRGFGYVEFDTRDDLIHVLSLPDPSIKGRRIRIDLSNENEQQNNRQRTNRRGYDGFSNASENRDSTNWRRDNQESSANDRGYNRERRRDNSPENITPGSWRTGGRPVLGDASPQRGSYGGDRYRDSKSRNYDTDRDRGRGRRGAAEEDTTQERPKLNLKPRTLPLPEIHTINVDSEVKESIETNSEDVENPPIKKSSGVDPAKVFGAAKPVDTASRELEIEERLAQSRRDEKLKLEQENKLRESSINEKLAEVQLEKPDKDTANTAISWRSRDEPLSNDKDDSGKYSPNRRGYSRRNNEDRRKDNRDFNREGKNHEKNERFKEKLSQHRDGTQKDENKPKRDTKPDRPMPKLQDQSEPVLQTSNKYSGLDTETSD